MKFFQRTMPEGAKKAVPYLCGGAFLSFASAKVRTSGDMAKLFNAFFSDFFTYTPALLIYKYTRARAYCAFSGQKTAKSEGRKRAENTGISWRRKYGRQGTAEPPSGTGERPPRHMSTIVLIYVHSCAHICAHM